MKKLLTFLLTALLAFSVGWAAEVHELTYTFTSSSAATLSGAPSGVSASFNSTYTGFTAGRGFQLTSGNSMTVTISGFTSSYKLTGITLNYCSNASSGAGTFSAALGSNSLGTYTLAKVSSGGTTHRNADLDITETVFDGNNLILTVSASANSLYVNYFKVTYEDDGGGSPSTDDCFRMISFKSGTGTSDAGTAMTENTILQNVESGTNYISSITNFDKVYLAKSGYGWKLGSSSAIGIFTVNLENQSDGWKVTKIVVNACRYSTSEGSIKVTTSANTTGSTISLTGNSSFNDYEIELNGADITSFTIATTSKRAYVKSVTLYVECEEDTDPMLTVTPPASLELTDIPHNAAAGAETTTTFTVAGVHLTGDVTVSINGADFSVSPTTLTPDANGSISETPITITYNGTSTTAVQGVVTVTCSSDNLTETFTVTAKKETPPAPTLTASPNPLNINDDNTSGGRTGSFTVTGANLPSNVGVDVMSGNFSRTTTGGQNPDWGFVNNNGVNGTVTVTYDGHALSETGIIRLASGNVTTNVDVNYLYTGPIYLFGNVGVDADHINNFDFSNGVAMTRNTTDGTYSVNITAVGQNGGSDSWMFFSKNQGDEATAVSTKFGPDSNGPWYLQGQTDYTGQSVLIDAADTGSNAATIHLNPGEYTVQVNSNNNTFTISALVHAPVISLASGNYEGNQTVTITSQTPGATIYYTTDGATPTTGSSSIANGGTVTISESCTLKAIAVSNGVTSTVTEATYVIIPPFEAKDYEMLTDIDDLVAGKTYLIVYKSSDDAATAIVMGPVSNDNIGVAVEDVPETNGIITSTEAMAPVTFTGESGNWTLLTSQGILRAEDANNLYVGDTPHTWRITQIKDANNNLTNKFAILSNTNTGRCIQFNNNNNQHRFACYRSTQQPVYIYKESSTPAILANPTTVSIELAAGEAQGSNTFTVGGRNLTGDVALTLSAEDLAKGFSLSTNSISKEAALAGNVEVTVTYNGQGANETASITLSSAGATDVTVTVNATREPLTVTISPASCNFVGQTMGELVTISANVAGATIEYSLDNGATWQTYTDGITITIGHVNNSVTVMARATLTVGGNTYTSETVSETYTRQPKGETLYEKVTDESQIKAGEKYIIVYEGTPEAIYDFYSDDSSDGGIGTPVVWRTQGKIVDIAGTSVIPFTMSGTIDAARFYDSDGYYLESSTKTGGGINLYDEPGENYAWNIVGDANGYYLTWTSYYNHKTYTVRYNSGVDANRGRFRLYDNSNSNTLSYPIAYLYVQHPAVLEPVITPATGEYSEHQDVTITAENGTTIYYTTDGSDPTSSSTPYEGQFTVHYDATSPTTTIKAIAVDDEGNVSTIAEAIYTWIAPKVTIRPATRDVYNPTLTVVIGCNPVDATIYYTTDDSEPSSSNGTLYEGPFEVTFASLGDQVTVKAIAYNDDDVPSAVDVATYTYAEKVINVDAPFFSPIEGGHPTGNTTFGGIYYGDQTLEIATSTANADIYYVIEQVSGTTPPSSVSDPTKSSTHYSEPYQMTVGNSYRVKAIAYIGDHASAVSEGYYIIKSTSEWTNHTDATTILENVAQLRTTTTGSKVTFRNPIQVVYMSTMANDPTPGSYTHPAPEYVYVRDNSGYGVIYFGKGATMWATQTSGRTNSPATIFEMGDWIDGSWICGTTGTWSSGLIPQVGTGEHTITSWPNAKLGNTKILAEDATCSDVRGATADNNLCGHYLHLRNTTLNDVENYSTSDTRHSGTISDASGACTYYDRFWLYSGSVEDNITFSYNGVSYTMSGLGHYDQAWFDEKGTNATFDVFCVGDYYSGISNPYEVYPLDFLWIFKPVITPPTNLNCTSQQVVDITVESPDWGDGPITPTIYYKTDDMEDWEEFIGPFIVNSDTHVQAYAQVHTDKFNDIVRSDVVSTEYKFANIKEPIITPDGYVIEVVTGEEEVTPNVTISTNLESPDAVTLYTTNGEVPTLENGTVVENGQVTLNPIKETTTVTAISYIEVSDGQGGTTLVWSKPVTQTYTFVKSNGVVYDLVSTVTTDKIYVIVNKDAYMGLSTSQNGNNRGSTGVMFTDGTKEHVYGNAELALFVLESASAGRYYFKNINGNGYLTVTTNDVANLSTSATASSYSEAGVTIAQDNGNPATIMFNYDGTNRYLRYFAKGRTFTTNADATLNENVFLYGTQVTPLAVIESEKDAGVDVQVTVADDLIAAWAVDNGTEKYVWAKDMGYSINKTSPVTGQTDYMMDVLKWQKNDWDQSNWVILDFSRVSANLNEIVGKKLTGGTVTGAYVEGKNNGGNYRIVLESLPTAVEDAEAAKYPGLGVATAAITANAEGKYNPANYNLGYNTYMTGNFNNANLNAPYGNGFVAGDDAAPLHQGEKLFFMNPKAQEVVRIWGVWDGKKFTVWECDKQNVNGWAIKGAFDVNWSRNAVSLSPIMYDEPDALTPGTEHIFHAVVALKQNTTGPNGAPRRASVDDETGASDEYEIYPLDVSNSGNPTSVTVVQAVKEVVSVRYYNVMGMESEKPFEGINIVVTRYSDGSASTMKVLR